MPYRLDSDMKVIRCSRRDYNRYLRRTGNIIINNTIMYAYGNYAKIAVLFSGIDKNHLFDVVLFTYLPDEKITLHGNYKTFKKACCKLNHFHTVISEVYNLECITRSAVDLHHLFPYG